MGQRVPTPFAPFLSARTQQQTRTGGVVSWVSVGTSITVGTPANDRSLGSGITVPLPCGPHRCASSCLLPLGARTPRLVHEADGVPQPRQSPGVSLAAFNAGWGCREQPQPRVGASHAVAVTPAGLHTVNHSSSSAGGIAKDFEFACRGIDPLNAMPPAAFWLKRPSSPECACDGTNGLLRLPRVSLKSAENGQFSGS